MTGDTVDCFNCGRSNPSWAQVCRSCGVPMRPGGAGAVPPSGPIPTDRDSLLSIGAALGAMALAIVVGLLFAGMLPEAAAVIETPSPTPSPTVLPSPSTAATPSASATPKPEQLPGTVTFGFGKNQSTQEVIDQSKTFAHGDTFCHSVAMPEAFDVKYLYEEVLRVENDGTLTPVQKRRDGRLGPFDRTLSTVGFCVAADLLIDGASGTEGWGTGKFVLRDYRQRGKGPELLAQGRFTLKE